MTKRVIEDIGREIVWIKEEEDSIEIAHRTYPIYPYGNNVTTYVCLAGTTLYVYTVRDSWNGTGRDDWGEVHLTEEEANRVKKAILSVSSIADFEKVTDLFRELLHDREEEIEKTFEGLYETIKELIAEDAVAEGLRQLKEMPKEELKEWLIEHFSDC